MLNQTDNSMRTARQHERQALLFNDRYNEMIRTRLHASFIDYLDIQVSRENALEETLNRLWRLEKRMLLKPLKVKVGMDQGEEGSDQGGVTCEFFRLVLSEAFKADNGE
jgi:hypothetical protein